MRPCFLGVNKFSDMKEKILVELTEADIKHLVNEKFGLDPDKTKASISYYAGDQREFETLKVTITGEKLGS